MGNLMIGMMIASMMLSAPQNIPQQEVEDAVCAIRQQTLNPYEAGGLYEHMEIIYKAGEERVVLTADDVIDWVRYWEDGHWDIDDDRITEFVESLREKFDTWNYDKILKTTGGKVIKIPAGEYGWRLDTKKEIAEISKMLRRNGTTVHNLHFSSEAASHTSPVRDYGDSYIEIDLTGQKLWLYEGGELVLESDIVSGLMNTDRQTPPGAYAIYYKQSPAVLKGEDYQTPVSYWMPFNGGIGLHDATWQPSFGGDACYYRGSHGCINLPIDVAEEIYSYMKKGFPVLCYY